MKQKGLFSNKKDPKVIESLRGPLTMEQVNNFIPAVNSHQDKHGYDKNRNLIRKNHSTRLIKQSEKYLSKKGIFTLYSDKEH